METFNAKPCVVMPWEMRTPIKAIFDGWPAPGPYTRQALEAIAGNSPLGQGGDENFLQPMDVGFGTCAVLGKSKDRISDYLTGPMIGDRPASFGSNDGDSGLLREVLLSGPMPLLSGTSRSEYGIDAP